MTTYRHPLPRHRKVLAAAAVLSAGVALAGCGEEDPAPGPEIAGGNAGVDVTVTEDLSVLDVELEYPLDGRYRPGRTPRCPRR